MKNLLLIYNPFSGDKTFKDNLDHIIEVFEKGDYLVTTYRIFGKTNTIDKVLSTMKNIDVLCISGGDGTINLCINSMKKHNVNVPLGIFPSGTANDFATFLDLPKDPIKAAKVIVGGITKNIDLGLANNKYFINVLCVGLFATISQTVDKDLKHNIGKLAYYIKAVETLPSAKKPMRLGITTSEGYFEEDVVLALIMNSKGAGGFFNLAPKSSIDDGKFDLILFKSGKFKDSAKSFINVFKGKHILKEGVAYYQDSYFKLQPFDNRFKKTDIDGETGPSLPVTVKVLKEDLTIFVKQ